MDTLRKQFAGVFDLSPEIILDLPLIMQVGNEKIYLENHKGIRSFNSEEIEIKIKNGTLLIKGRKLLIKEINLETLCISGVIVSLSYEIKKEGIHK